LKWEMAGTASEESGVGRSTEGFSSGQRCQSGEALAEWRSSEQVENEPHQLRLLIGKLMMIMMEGQNLPNYMENIRGG